MKQEEQKGKWECGSCKKEVTPNGEHLCEKPAQEKDSEGWMEKIHTIIWMAILADSDETVQEKSFFASEKILVIIREQIKAERARTLKEIGEIIGKTLNEWTTFTCHSRKEHNKPDSDCPGWSHEDQKTRETVISQVRHDLQSHIKELSKENE